MHGKWKTVKVINLLFSFHWSERPSVTATQNKLTFYELFCPNY